RSTDRIPPRLSTGSLVSFTWAGTKRTAMTSATTARGSVTMNTEPHQNGPSEAIAPPSADHRAIERVRAGPDHRAVMSASVVGYAMPADTPPRMRARTRTLSVGAYAASRLAGIDRAMPRTSISLRP